jgi:hypothetical protein
MTNPVELTCEQVKFIQTAPPEVVLTACPGSGKTLSAVRRFFERCRACNEYAVAFLSYTNVAVAEALACADELSAGGLIGYPNLVSTLDSFFRSFVFEPFIRIVKPAVPAYIEIADDGVPVAVSSDQRFNIYGFREGRPVKVWEIRAFVGDDGSGYEYKRDDYSDEWLQVPRGRHEEIGRAKVILLEGGYATYNDILLFCRMLLRKSELRIAEILAHRFGEIIVDEAQDTTMLQQSMLASIASRGAKIAYVGDKRQAIYKFNRANPKYLDELIAAGHAEYFLSKNFRSIEEIVGVVNAHFNTQMAHGAERRHELHGAYVVVGSESLAIEKFTALLDETESPRDRSAVLVRQAGHLKAILKDHETKQWRTGPKLALEAWQRERRQDVEKSLRSAARLMRSTLQNDDIVTLGEAGVNELGWLFLRGPDFPQPSASETPREWAERLREGLKRFLEAQGFRLHENFGPRMALNGIPSVGSALNEFDIRRPELRTTVIHQVKGESISAVLVVAPVKLHKVWLDTKVSDEELGEELNVCYVAFTRAAELLVLHCPTNDIAAEWRKRGFRDLP